MRVLLTGSEGSIGRVLRAGLDHEVIGLDLVEDAEHVGDCADAAWVSGVVGEVRPDAIVHLAGIPEEAALTEELDSHVLTTAALLDAMVAHGVGRMVYAGSNHAVGRTPRDEPVDLTSRPRPDTFYGVAKVAAEALLSLYADRHGIDAVSCRIGSFLERPETRRNLSTWLSHADACRMVEAALTGGAGFEVLYGISANTRAWWDLEPGRRLGYEPHDDAEDFAAVIEAMPESDADVAEAAYVGGPYATDGFIRPAFN